MDIYEHIAEMNPLIQKQDWEGLEAKYSALCKKLSGVNESQKIGDIALGKYQKLLLEGLKKSVLEAKKHKARAIYFEYDLDNSWDSNFFICHDYNSELQNDEDWACDWASVVEGPSQEQMSFIFVENYFDQTDKAKGNTLYLVARTLSNFGMAMQEIDCYPFIICVAFHDQSPIMRMNIREA